MPFGLEARKVQKSSHSGALQPCVRRSSPFRKKYVMLLESSKPVCLQDRIRVLGCKVLGCRILQPNTGKTVLAGEGNSARGLVFFRMGGFCVVLR
jgi:hypothetical protein